MSLPDPFQVPPQDLLSGLTLSVLLEPRVEYHHKQSPWHLLGWGPLLSTPFLVIYSSVLPSLGTRAGTCGALPHATHTAHHHFAHCLFTLHMSPRRERWKIKCIYTVMDKGL